MHSAVDMVLTKETKSVLSTTPYGMLVKIRHPQNRQMKLVRKNRSESIMDTNLKKKLDTRQDNRKSNN